MNKELENKINEKTKEYCHGWNPSCDHENSSLGYNYKEGMKSALTPEVISMHPEVQKLVEALEFYKSSGFSVATEALASWSEFVKKGEVK